MDLRSSKKNQFDAFKGFSLTKTNSVNTGNSKMDLNRMALTNSKRGLNQAYDFDNAWKGSVSNLMSTENITEDLIKESIKELENAMNESKRMLAERDEEILRLREVIENNHCNEKMSFDDSIFEQYEKSQKRILELEKEIAQLKIKHSKELEESRRKLTQQNEKWSNQIKHGIPECTCYCGSVCQALNDLKEMKKTHEQTKNKYETLRRKVREFKKQAEENQQQILRSHFEEEKSACVIQ